MSTQAVTTSADPGAYPGIELASRALAAAYSLTAYAIGTGALFWVIFAAGGLAPHGLTSLQVGHPVAAIAINIALVLAFAAQHTIMARKWFKEAVSRIIPQPVERSTYVLAAGIAMAALVYYWQTVPGVTWVIQAPWAVNVIRAIYVLGIGYLLGSSFVTNHFELFGLRQAWLYCTGREYTPVQFKQAWVYRYSRHPMMLGLLMAFWATPEMSATRFVLAALLTLYILVGIRFEERSLIQEHGETYRAYQQKIGMFFTLRK
jgi:protein-S-isoprenylcysteine O-methyltransferase Ste14